MSFLFFLSFFPAGIPLSFLALPACLSVCPPIYLPTKETVPSVRPSVIFRFSFSSLQVLEMVNDDMILMRYRMDEKLRSEMLALHGAQTVNGAQVSKQRSYYSPLALHNPSTGVLDGRKDADSYGGVGGK